MDQMKIGKFIASCRKEQGMTQAVLAEKLGISDRAISKWETGKSMPDSGIMLDLCELLKINVNELLSGERIMAEAYDKRAEGRRKEPANAQDGILDCVSSRHCWTGHGVCSVIYRDASLAENRTNRIRSRDDNYGRFYRCGN